LLKEGLHSFTWLNPTKVNFGAGGLAKLRSIVDNIAGPASRVFLITGLSSLRRQGTLQKVLDDLGEARVTLFDKASPFPSPELVDRALEECRAAAANVVVAIGGGSPLDLGKAVAILMTHEGTSREYGFGERTLQRRGIPFIAVPTTSGSSSEVTPFAALWDMEAKSSMRFGSPLAFPEVAIVDPELTLSMPKSLAAVTGMDAFTSAFEAYWSMESEPLADAIELQVIRLFAANLERSCLQGDLESRSWCALAATMSGIAYSNSRPNACHAIGNPLTIFWGAEHGQAVGISLPALLAWNAPAISHKLPALWDALGVKDLNEATNRLAQIIERCGLESRLSGLGLQSSDMETLLDHIRWDRVGVLPRALSREDARGLLEKLM
jgi:alcohol dehydrogenase class IV